MQNPPIKLVPRPTADDEARKSVIKLLRLALERAERGEVLTAIVILQHPGNSWSNGVGGALNASETVGRLEIAKSEWVERYLRETVSE